MIDTLELFVLKLHYHPCMDYCVTHIRLLISRIKFLYFLIILLPGSYGPEGPRNCDGYKGQKPYQEFWDRSFEMEEIIRQKNDKIKKIESDRIYKMDSFYNPNSDLLLKDFSVGYKGEWSDGFAHGIGILCFPDGKPWRECLFEKGTVYVKTEEFV